MSAKRKFDSGSRFGAKNVISFILDSNKALRNAIHAKRDIPIYHLAVCSYPDT